MQGFAFVAGLISSIVGGPAPAADAYPSRPIRVVVTSPAGGNTDLLARMIGKGLTEAMGQPVIVENRPGGNTLIGTRVVAQAAPDGYTIMLSTLTLTVIPSVYKQPPFDVPRDFTPITLAVTLPNVLVVNISLPAKSLKEFVAYAKTHPGKLNYASTGDGTSPHLSMELLKVMAGVDLAKITYKGGAQALTDLIGGQVSAQFVGLPVALPHITAGKLRALGVTSGKRAAAAPNIPTVAETLEGFDLNTWFGVLGPRSMPDAVVRRLQREISRIVHSPESKEKLAAMGAEPVGNSPDEFASFIASEIEKYRTIVKSAGIPLK